jgi:excisionase family DNA binding protein
MSKLAQRRQRQATEELPPDHLRPIREASPLTGVPKRTIAQWAQQGRIEAQKFGPRIWYVNVDDVRRVAATLKPGPKPKKAQGDE